MSRHKAAKGTDVLLDALRLTSTFTLLTADRITPTTGPGERELVQIFSSHIRQGTTYPTPSDMRELLNVIHEKGKTADAELLYYGWQISTSPKNNDLLGDLVPLELLKRSAELGYAPAQASLAGEALSGRYKGLTEDQARELARTALQSHDALVYLWYADRYVFADCGFRQDTVTAFEYYKFAVEHGATRGYVRLALCYAGMGDQSSYSKTLRAGAEAGNMFAQAQLVEDLRGLPDTPAGQEEIRKWMHAAARAGHPQMQRDWAKFLLAKRDLNGVDLGTV